MCIVCFVHKDAAVVWSRGAEEFHQNKIRGKIYIFDEGWSEIFLLAEDATQEFGDSSEKEKGRLSSFLLTSANKLQNINNNNRNILRTIHSSAVSVPICQAATSP